MIVYIYERKKRGIYMTEKEINSFITLPDTRRKYLPKLIEAAKHGSKEDFDILYKAYYSDAYYVSYNILDSKENAEDITQDTFFKAYSSLDKLSDPLSFEAWIRRIAANLSINYLKKSKRLVLETDDEIIRLSDEQNSEPDPEETTIDSDIRDTLEEIISRLPEEQRQSLFLFYYESMSTREIAEMYGCSENTIKSRLRYARQFMKKEVEKLENNGFRLRCLTVLPFLYLLYQAQRAEINVIPADSLFSATASAAAGATAINAASAVTAAGEAGDLTLSAKIGIGAICAAVAIGCTIGGIYIANTYFLNTDDSIALEDINYNNWGVADVNSVYYNSSYAYYAVNVPRIRTFTESSLAYAYQGDGTLVMHGGINLENAAPDEISYSTEKFPGNFSVLKSTLSNWLGQYDWKIDSAQTVTINGYDMIRYECSEVPTAQYADPDKYYYRQFCAYATTLKENNATVYWLCMNTSGKPENYAAAQLNDDRMARTFRETTADYTYSPIKNDNGTYKLELVSINPQIDNESIVSFELPERNNSINYGVRSMGLQGPHLIDCVYTNDPSIYESELVDDPRRYVFLRDSLSVMNFYKSSDPEYKDTVYADDYLKDHEYFKDEFVRITDDDSVSINGYRMTRVEGIFTAHYKDLSDGKIKTRPMYFVYYYTQLHYNGETVVFGYVDDSEDQSHNSEASKCAKMLAESLQEE